MESFSLDRFFFLKNALFELSIIMMWFDLCKVAATAATTKVVAAVSVAAGGCISCSISCSRWLQQVVAEDQSKILSEIIMPNVPRAYFDALLF